MTLGQQIKNELKLSCFAILRYIILGVSTLAVFWGLVPLAISITLSCVIALYISLNEQQWIQSMVKPEEVRYPKREVMLTSKSQVEEDQDIIEEEMPKTFGNVTLR